MKSWSKAKIIICIGSGGVGKTTVSASIGLWGALQNKKTLVLTVDPAKRLATTLGIKDDGEDHFVLKRGDGELWASVLNSKKIFDSFLTKSAEKGLSSETIEKILKNKLYQQLSTTLSGSQEFTAIEKLYSSAKSQKYDLIILDTPPTKHAIDFLEAPLKISEIFNESIVHWFQKPMAKKNTFLGQLFQSGTEKVLQILQLLTGSDFVFQLRDFFQNIESMQKDLESRTQAVHNLLLDSQTIFNLVTAFDAAKIHEASYIAAEINKRGHHLESLTMNRAYPEWVPKPFNTGSQIDLFCQKLNSYYKDRLENFESMKQNLSDLEIIMLPEYDEDISDIEGLEKLVRDFKV